VLILLELSDAGRSHNLPLSWTKVSERPKRSIKELEAGLFESVTSALSFELVVIVCA